MIKCKQLSAPHRKHFFAESSDVLVQDDTSAWSAKDALYVTFLHVHELKDERLRQAPHSH